MGSRLPISLISFLIQIKPYHNRREGVVDLCQLFVCQINPSPGEVIVFVPVPEGFGYTDAGPETRRYYSSKCCLKLCAQIPLAPCIRSVSCLAGYTDLRGCSQNSLNESSNSMLQILGSLLSTIDDGGLTCSVCKICDPPSLPCRMSSETEFLLETAGPEKPSPHNEYARMYCIGLSI